MHRRLLVVVTVGLLLVAGFWYHKRYMRYEKEYARLIPGTTKAEVLRRFGKPKSISRCVYSLSCDDKPVNEKSVKCVQEFEYYSRMRIGEWVIGFDANDRAVSKHYLSSP
jgi:hypothetical protein